MLNLSYEDGNFPPYNVQAVFLDEFRMMIYTPVCTEDPPEFTLFDTSVSQAYPTNFRRFRLPLKYLHFYPSMALDACIGLGMLNQDEPLIVDPIQAFVLLQLSINYESTNVAIALRIKALVEQACLVGADTYIPWGELERDAVVVEMLVPYPGFHVQGVNVIHKASDGDEVPACFRARAFPFSRLGCSTLRDADGETVRKVWRERGRDFTLEMSEGIAGRNPSPLGNGVFYCLVCGFCHLKVPMG